MFVQEYLNSVFEEKVEKMHMVSILCCFLNKKKIYCFHIIILLFDMSWCWT